MPRKSVAGPVAAKGAARAKAPASKAAGKAPAKAAAPGRSKSGVKGAVKAAAQALAGRRAPAARKPPAVAVVPRDAILAARPVLVRDSFTMPENEYAVLAQVKQACLRAGVEVKKSELLRIGVALLGQIDVATLKTVLGTLPQLKTGRPPAQD